jgi:hypothetical protein
MGNNLFIYDTLQLEAKIWIGKKSRLVCGKNISANSYGEPL